MIKLAGKYKYMYEKQTPINFPNLQLNEINEKKETKTWDRKGMLQQNLQRNGQRSLKAINFGKNKLAKMANRLSDNNLEEKG